MRYLPIPEVAMHLLITIWLSLVCTASADRFTADNTSGNIKFELDSTLHVVPGDATSFTTELNVEEKVTGKLVIQAESIQTGIGVRDQRMYDYCLDSKKYPTIVFDVRGITGDVDGFKSKQGNGTVNLHGQLSIRSTTRDLVIPATYSWSDAGIALAGKTTVLWTDFGVPDPSIMISKVQPKLELSFDANMKKSF
jgi:polyisoprenoid-binding protein YceI